MSGVLKFCTCAEKIPQLGNVFGAQGCLGTWNFLATSSVHGRSSVERQRQQQWNCGQSLRTYGCEARPRTFTNLASWNADGALQAKFFGLLSASRNEHRWVVGGSAPGYQEFSALDSGGAGRCPDVALDPQNDVLALPYSSGTTGLPKGVLLTHRNILANIAQLQTVLPLEAGQDRMLGVLPFYHIYGMVVVQFSSLFQGAALLTLPRFHPDDFLHAIEAHRSTVLPLVPPLVLFLAKEPAVENRDMSSVRTIISGAAPLSRNVTEEAMSRTKATIQQAYGLTELSPVSHFNTPPIKFGTIGPLVPSTLAKIVNVETGKALGSNMAGELCVKGPQVMKGYLNNQKATEEMVRDGWVHTGDVGYYDEDGYVTITDRIKELIKYKGYQVPPAELEAVVLSHPAVKDAAVIGIPDDVSGELPRAYVTLKPDCTVSMEEIANYVKERVAPYKQLRGGVYPVDEVPKTASGKILRRVLLARAKAGH